jgi:UDP-N-acetylmuramoylalanine--D-glutamate ligase
LSTESPSGPRHPDGPHLVHGLGVTGRAVARALVAHGEDVVLVDDRPTDEARAFAADLGVDLVGAPSPDALDALVRVAGAVVPAPGLPARHRLFGLAGRSGVPVLSEFDLAARWDRRPVLAITGTDGKTTVTTLVRDMLVASGIAAEAVGNTEVPLVAAIGDPTVDVFVVEASSFRLEHSRWFAPDVATWLNFAPDHLDSHPTLAAYEAAKARIWRDQRPDQVAVGNAEDPIVARHLARAPARRVGFAAGQLTGSVVPEVRVVDGVLIGPGEIPVVAVDDLPRQLPHDVSNALAAIATAMSGGASAEAAGTVLLGFQGLPHRVAFVCEVDGVRYYDDSKATTPHAAVAGVSGFSSVVMISGGRDKGLDLRGLTEAADRIRAVVAIGEAAGLVEAAFDGVRPVVRAGSMDEAVATAHGLAEPGDAVVLAPGCASFDWYRSYGERGDDFARAAREVGGVPA